MDPESIYSDSGQKPDDHIQHNLILNRPIPSDPSYGIDSPLGLVSSLFFAPLYLYASKKGKLEVWDNLLNDLPVEIFSAPALDMGCGRGMVLLKIAARKKKVALESTGTVSPVYGVDLFITGDQSGNAPEATFDNAACLQLTDHVVLHTASFAELPFRDGSMGLVTASLSIHNADKPTREKAIASAARVLRPGGFLVILELAGYVGEYRKVLEAKGWTDVETAFGGMQVMFGIWPCQVLKARKP